MPEADVEPEWFKRAVFWIPPFFPSPLRDGGYDVADYTDVAPELGTIDDFAELLEKAHSRGIRIIIDFVMNHTSDQHSWFQSTPSRPTGLGIRYASNTSGIVSTATSPI